MQHAHMGGAVTNDQWITDDKIKDPSPLPTIPNYRILIRPVAIRSTTKGGIILPDKARDDVQYLTTVGRVVLLGDLSYQDKERFPKGPWCNEGDYVCYGKHTGTRFLYKGVMFVIMNDDQILMRVEEPGSLDPMFVLTGQMANTTNLGIEKPTVGGSENAWGTTLNTGSDGFDTAVAGTLSKSVAGDANVSLTDAEALNANHIYTGTLTGNIAVHVPIKSRRYQVFNNTSGSFTLKVKTSSETNGTTIDQGTTMVLFCDATSVIDGTSGSGSTSVSDFTANTLNVPTCASVTNLVAATGSFTTKVSGVAGEFSGTVSAATFDGNLTGNVTGDVDGATGSYSACVSATNFVAATGSFTTKVSGVAAEFSGNVSAAEYYGGGGNLTGVGGGYYKGDNGATGSSAGDIFRINELALDANVTITSSENGSATGPLTVSSGVTLTVEGTLVII